VYRQATVGVFAALSQMSHENRDDKKKEAMEFGQATVPLKKQAGQRRASSENEK